MENNNLQSSLKSNDTEEWIDLVFYRKLGYRMAMLAQRWGITPNQITITSIFFGIAAGVLFFFNDLVLNVVGMLLLMTANTMDSADGQLARMTRNFSPIGRWLDGACGDLWFISIYTALAIRFTVDGYPLYIWPFLAVVGFFHSKQAALADYYRTFHLMFLKNKKESEFIRNDEKRAAYAQLSWRKEFIPTLIEFTYMNYTRGQESLTPNLQRFYRLMREKYGDDIPVSLREEFRQKSKPLMKYTNILSFNTRVIVLFISLFAGYPLLYFLFEITVLNGLWIYMRWKHERICCHFYTKMFRNEA